DLVDAEVAWRLEVDARLAFGDVVVEDVPDCLLVEADLARQRGERLTQATTSDVGHQASRGEAFRVEVRDIVETLLARSLAANATSSHRNLHSLAVGGRIPIALRLRAVAMQPTHPALRTRRRKHLAFRLDRVFAALIVDGQHS